METNIEFKKYVRDLTLTPLYKDFPFEYKGKLEFSKFVAASVKDRGLRLEWMRNEAIKFGEDPEIKPSEFMRKHHPFGYTVCKVCGSKMSVNYIYPNKNTAKKLGVVFEDFDSIIDLYRSKKRQIDDLFGIKSESELIEITKLGTTRKLSPGAMSNFPDRLDGFHTYNLCCRKTVDKGRASENMDKYNKDRRIFEYMSDGNIRAANKRMKDKIFKGLSADHVGPISLGFRHEPYLLVPMTRSENSSKNNRITKNDVDELLRIEEAGYPVISDYAEGVWKQFKMGNIEFKNLKSVLQQNAMNYYELMRKLITEAPEEFHEVMKNKLKSFDFEYQYDEKGFITKEMPRVKTASAESEIDRAIRIAKDYLFNETIGHSRKIKPTIKEIDKNKINKNTKYGDILDLLSHYYVSAI